MSQALTQAMGWALVHLVWQGTLVALLLAGALALVGRRAAHARYALAAGAMALLVALPLVTGWREYRARRDGALAGSTMPATAPRALAGGGAGGTVSTAATTTTTTTTTTAPMLADPLAAATPPALVPLVARGRALVNAHLAWLVLAWLLGVALSSARLGLSWLRLRRLVAASSPAPAGWQARLDALAHDLGLTRPIRLLQSATLEVPAAIGWLRPLVLVPLSTLAGLPPRQLELVLAHELAHIRRHDFIVNLAQLVVETLLFYHPAVWWISHVLRVEREHACDDIAVGSSGSAVAYARALTMLETLRVSPLGEPSPALSALGGSLPERVRRLINAPAARCGSRWIAGASALTLLGSVAVAAPLTVFAMTQSAVDAAVVAVAAPADDDDDDDDNDVPMILVPEVQVLPHVVVTPHVVVPAPHVVVVPTPTPVAVPTAPVAPSAPLAPLPPLAPLAPLAAGSPTPTPTPQPAPQPRPRPHDRHGDDGARVGVDELTVDQVVQLKLAGMTLERIKEIEALGYAPTVAQLTGLGFAGVSIADLKEAAQRLGHAVDLDTVIEMKHMGVTADYLAGLKAEGYGGDVRAAISARAVGVSLDYVRALKAAGVTPDSLQDLVQLRAVGVTPEFVRELRDAGMTGLDTNELVRLRTGGVDADFIRRVRGHKK